MMKKGFTLVELMIVMAILSSLVGLVAGGFRSAQIRGRDAQRKSDLKQIANAIELLFSDYNQYPDDSNGAIVACPFDADGSTSTVCTWGTSDLTDGKSIYLKNIPKDPASGLSYFYRVVPGSNNLKYQIFAHLENKEDISCIGDNCTTPPGITYMCGSSICNFAVTSSNTDYSE